MDIDGRSDDEALSVLQKYRRKEYEKLTDAVYAEKGYDRNGIPLEASHRVARSHRQPLPDRHDRTRPETRSLVQVVHINGAPVRLKKLRPWGHRRGMDDDIAVRMRAELER